MSETRESNRNGKRSRGSSPSTINNYNANKPSSASVAEDLTPETSDDDSRKDNYEKLNLNVSSKFLIILLDSKKNLGKPKNGKSEFEGELKV